MAFPDGWGKRHKITIDKDLVGGGSEDESNIPILLTEDNFLSDAFSNSDDGGGDIRFSSDADGATQLACEIVTWDTGDSTAEVWVKISTLTYGSDTVIYVWYDNTGQSQPAADSTYGSEAVWSNGFGGVWHMQETSGTRYDSTGNDNDLTDNGSVSYNSSGKIGNAAEIEDHTDYFSITDAAQTGLEPTTQFTLTCWVNFDSLSSVGNIMTKWSNSAARSYYFNENGTSMYLSLSSDGGWPGDSAGNTLATNQFATGNWYFMNATFNAGTAKIYNGVDCEVTNTGAPASIYNNTQPFILGQSADLYGSQDLNGKLDEVRMATTCRTPGWISTEYYNQYDPSAFAVGSDATEMGGTPVVGPFPTHFVV
jgi:hypothetical protein